MSLSVVFKYMAKQAVDCRNIVVTTNFYGLRYNIMYVYCLGFAHIAVYCVYYVIVQVQTVCHTCCTTVWLLKNYSQRIGSRPSDHYFRSVCLSVCLFVCLLVQSFSQPSLSDFDQTWTYVICLGLVVSRRI